MPAGWNVVQAVWFGGYFQSAAVNSAVDEVRREDFALSSARLPGLSPEAAERLATGSLTATKPPFPTGPYLGLQASLMRARGLACLLGRLPQLSVRRVTSVDSMAITADCPGRYALRTGNSNSVNWGVEEALAGWHTTRWAREVQRGVYQEDEARRKCASTGLHAGPEEGANCSEADICSVSGVKFLLQGCGR